MSARKSDLKILQRLVRDQVIRVLETFAGEKDLVIESELLRVLDRVMKASVLKQHGAKHFIKLEPDKILRSCSKRIYIVRPWVESARIVCEQIASDDKKQYDCDYVVAFVPRRCATCEKVFEEEGFYGRVVFDEISLFMLALDDDILSFEMRQFFKSEFLDQDLKYIATIARGLLHFKELYGKIPNVHVFGQVSQCVLNMLQSYENLSTDPSIPMSQSISQMIVLDRDIDYISVLLSPLTYQGLLEENFSINAGTVEFGKEVHHREQSVKWILNAQDEVFSEICNKHFAFVMQLLSSKAKTIQKQYDKRHDMKINEMKEFVSQHLKSLSGQHRALALHVGASEVITKRKTILEFEKYLNIESSILDGSDIKACFQFIEEKILSNYEILPTLRLMCLLSLTLDGIPLKTYNDWKRLFLHSYGHEHILTFHRLRELKILFDQSSAAGHLSKLGVRTSNFASKAKELGLINNDSRHNVDIRSENAPSYVFNGSYTPLCSVIAEKIWSSGKG